MVTEVNVAEVLRDAGPSVCLSTRIASAQRAYQHPRVSLQMKSQRELVWMPVFCVRLPFIQEILSLTEQCSARVLRLLATHYVFKEVCLGSCCLIKHPAVTESYNRYSPTFLPITVFRLPSIPANPQTSSWTSTSMSFRLVTNDNHCSKVGSLERNWGKLQKDTA